jgi:hypothetical protein
MRFGYKENTFLLWICNVVYFKIPSVTFNVESEEDREEQYGSPVSRPGFGLKTSWMRSRSVAHYTVMLNSVGFLDDFSVFLRIEKACMIKIGFIAVRTCTCSCGFFVVAETLKRAAQKLSLAVSIFAGIKWHRKNYETEDCSVMKCPPVRPFRYVPTFQPRGCLEIIYSIAVPTAVSSLGNHVMCNA